jgi:hypothetical protein
MAGIFLKGGEAATQLSGSRIGHAHGWSWVDSGMAAFGNEDGKSKRFHTETIMTATDPNGKNPALRSGLARSWRAR